MFGCQFTRMAGLYGNKVPDYLIVGYVSGMTEVSRKDADMLTHINYAFARIKDDGQLYFS